MYFVCPRILCRWKVATTSRQPIVKLLLLHTVALLWIGQEIPFRLHITPCLFIANKRLVVVYLRTWFDTVPGSQWYRRTREFCTHALLSLVQTEHAAPHSNCAFLLLYCTVCDLGSIRDTPVVVRALSVNCKLFGSTHARAYCISDTLLLAGWV